MCLIRHRSGLLRQLPQLKQLVGHYLAIGLAANLSELSIDTIDVMASPEFWRNFDSHFNSPLGAIVDYLDGLQLS
jgi:hypothetical protein